tara:strand:+ start:39566 stop:40066 length:501 start_codon:yes stop_codon:yes gene_type:complete
MKLTPGLWSPAIAAALALTAVSSAHAQSGGTVTLDCVVESVGMPGNEVGHHGTWRIVLNPDAHSLRISNSHVYLLHSGPTDSTSRLDGNYSGASVSFTDNQIQFCPERSVACDATQMTGGTRWSVRQAGLDRRTGALHFSTWSRDRSHNETVSYNGTCSRAPERQF